MNRFNSIKDSLKYLIHVTKVALTILTLMLLLKPLGIASAAKPILINDAKKCEEHHQQVEETYAHALGWELPEGFPKSKNPGLFSILTGDEAFMAQAKELALNACKELASYERDSKKKAAVATGIEKDKKINRFLKEKKSEKWEARASNDLPKCQIRAGSEIEDIGGIIRLFGEVVEAGAKKNIDDLVTANAAKQRFRCGNHCDDGQSKSTASDAFAKDFRVRERVEEGKGTGSTTGDKWHDFYKGLGGGSSIWNISDKSHMNKMNRLFGLNLVGADISGTTADFLYLLDKFDAGNTCLRLLPLLTILKPGHHSLLEIMTVINFNRSANLFEVGDYTTLIPQRCTFNGLPEWKQNFTTEDNYLFYYGNTATNTQKVQGCYNIGNTKNNPLDDPEFYYLNEVRTILEEEYFPTKEQVDRILVVGAATRSSKSDSAASATSTDHHAVTRYKTTTIRGRSQKPKPTCPKPTAQTVTCNNASGKSFKNNVKAYSRYAGEQPYTCSKDTKKYFCPSAANSCAGNCVCAEPEKYKEITNNFTLGQGCVELK